MVVQAILRIPELLVQLGYHQLLAHQWLSWFAAWLTFKEARVQFPAMAVYYLHLFPCVITWFISSMAGVNWDRLNETTVLWVWAGWWCKILWLQLCCECDRVGGVKSSEDGCASHLENSWTVSAVRLSPTFSSSMAQLVCCLTHVQRVLGSIPSKGSLLFAFISMCYYMIYFIYGCGKLG